MGIKGLTKLLNEEAPNSLREQNIKSYFGRAIAIDASMALYQFLIAVRSDGPGGLLTNDNGEVTSHLIGMFYRTIRMLSHGIKPVYVFDGKPPQMKQSEELIKRRKKREEAKAELEKAQKGDDTETILKMEKRLVKCTKQHSDEAKQLLRLMGVPVVQAESEAEATCAAMCAAGLVYATASEDMDTLTFGSTRMVRHLTYSEARQAKSPIIEINLPDALEGLGFSMPEFVDMCMLCGCDYIPTISKVGPKTALKYMREHRSIEKILENLPEKHKVPPHFNYIGARDLFVNPEITKPKDIKLKWTGPDEAGLKKFLVDEKGFSLERVESGIRRLNKAKGKSSQKRLESFFGAVRIKRKKPQTKGKKGKKAKKQKKGKTKGRR